MITMTTITREGSRVFTGASNIKGEVIRSSIDHYVGHRAPIKVISPAVSRVER
jgi:hypothetical protein